MGDEAIAVRGLHKSYGDVQAVRGIDLTVDRGEVFALLGPNGAGKTTAVEILEGYRERSAGEVDVLGHDPAKRSRAMRERIGIVLQSTGVDPYLTVRETIRLYAGYYPSPRDPDEVIELVDLAEKRDVRVIRLSGGQQRRADELPPDRAGRAIVTGDGLLELIVSDATRALHDLTGWALERGIELEGLHVAQPTLEDVYLELTGGEAGQE